MEIRTLRYFLALAEAKTIAGASRILHVTQPTLSRQLTDLEKEFGKQLFLRGPKGITLTGEGKRLVEYAHGIIELSEKAFNEIAAPEHLFKGDVYIAAGETRAIGIMHRAAVRMQNDYPHVRYHITSGVTSDLLPRFDSGFFDFFLECEIHRRARCNTLVLRNADTWGVITKKDSRLAELDYIRPQDLANARLIVPPFAYEHIIRKWAGDYFSSYRDVATFSLPLNGTFLVADGVGEMLCYENLIEANEDSALTFRKLSPGLSSSHGIHWKKDRTLSQSADLYLKYLRNEYEREFAEQP